MLKFKEKMKYIPNSIITRFAPSPTGYLHVGNARTALINWLFARHCGGEFILRIDDTDKERSEERYVKAIKDDLKWLGINWDATFDQSSRQGLYDAAIKKLKGIGRLYACYETPEELTFKRKRQLAKGLPPKYDREGLFLSEEKKKNYEQEGRKPHWRFKLEDEEIKWDDMVHGPLAFQARNLSDPILVKPDGTIVFTLATVVDDIDKNVTNILRGDDHISNTAAQVQIREALGGSEKEIKYGHMPLITSQEGEGLSKRMGSQSLRDFADKNIEPLALASLLATMGTSMPIHFVPKLEKLIEIFNIKNFSTSSAKFNPEDLKKINQEAFQNLPVEEVNRRLKDSGCLPLSVETWKAVAANSTTLQDVIGWQKIFQEGLFSIPEEMQVPEKFYSKALEEFPKAPVTEKTWKIWMENMKERIGLKGKQLIMPLRIALTGRQHGPEMKDIVVILGRVEVEKRLHRMLEK